MREVVNYEFVETDTCVNVYRDLDTDKNIHLPDEVSHTISNKDNFLRWKLIGFWKRKIK